MGSTASVGGKSFLPRGLLRKVSSEPITEPIDERFRSTLERALLTVSLCLQSCNGAEPTRRVIIRSIFLVLFFTLFSLFWYWKWKCKMQEKNCYRSGLGGKWGQSDFQIVSEESKVEFFFSFWEKKIEFLREIPCDKEKREWSVSGITCSDGSVDR